MIWVILAALRELLAEDRSRYEHLRGLMILLQEGLDWTCYRLYGLTDEVLTWDGDPLPLAFGERSFEILMARDVASAGLPPTTWFERHRAEPLTGPPAHWPEEYTSLYHRRHTIQQSNRSIGLIEQPEYKRRWNTEPWESQLERALRQWLLNRLESYFDYDGRMDGEGGELDAESGGHGDCFTDDVTLQEDARVADGALSSIARLADVARRDPGFTEVGGLYRDDAAFDVQRLVEELVKAEHVPLLPVLRYKPAGLRKRQVWE